MSNHPMNYTTPSLNLMKLGVHVDLNTTASILKFLTCRTSGLGNIARQIFSFFVIRGVVANFHVLISRNLFGQFP